MKRKLLLSILTVSLISALIGGATMAWFTDEAKVTEVHFQAGTVKVATDADSPNIAVPPGKSLDNVNPGDCATITWNIVNEGTKAAQLRVNLKALWDAAPGISEDLTLDNVYYVPAPDSSWVLYEDTNKVLWLVYPESVRGTYNSANPEMPLEPAEIPLTVVIGFDGIGTGNEYQGAEFTLGSEGSQVEAIQASNNAPLAVWGDEWEAVLNRTYVPVTGLDARYMNYFSPGQPGYEMVCFQHFIGGDDNPPANNKKYKLTVEVWEGDSQRNSNPWKLVKSDQQGASDYAAKLVIPNLAADAAVVKLTAKEHSTAHFVEWQYKDGSVWKTLTNQGTTQGSGQSAIHELNFPINTEFLNNPDQNGNNKDIYVRALYGSPQ
ncbi:MAG: hypothetical protein GXY50_02885 [Syntrophomonadaceae bacterium]|nr:hypothetical protein [Syntrophomonadaceae bacterium]